MSISDTENMSEFHSMAYTYTTTTTSPSLAWDHVQNLGLFTTDMSLVMDGTSQFLPQLDYSGHSSGYLEDALFEFEERTKRRRVEDLSCSVIQNCYWNNSDCNWDLSGNVQNFHGISDEPVISASTMSSEELNYSLEVKTPEEAISSSSSSKTKSIFNHGRSEDGDDNKKDKRVITRVVYPFALVKPGGVDGDVTLNDINERILMPPSRPVRHPVGDFASRPCVSPHGPGLSGKMVVALTRIQTRGRGTITIMRTRG